MTYRIDDGQMSGGRSDAGTIIEERQEVYAIPAPPPAPVYAAPASIYAPAPSIRNASPPPVTYETRQESTFIERDRKVRNVEYVERSNEMVQGVGPLALAVPEDRGGSRKDERAIRAEIKALEAEKEALRIEKKASKEMRRAERLRREGAGGGGGEMVMYERDERYERREREPEGGVRIEKDKKGRMSISVPKSR